MAWATDVGGEPFPACSQTEIDALVLNDQQKI
jgi:hypothetical protein